MKKDLVKTSNYERFRTGITAVENRGAPETGMLLVIGLPGVSKSIIVNRWAVEVKAVYLCAAPLWTPTRFIDALAERLKVDASGRRQEVYGRIVGAIARARTPIVIDEVQRTLVNGALTLDAIRALSDLTETVVVLVAGDDGVLARIKRYPPIARRINRVVEFEEASLDDVALTCREKAEVEIADDLVAEIHRQSRGIMGHVINAIATVEYQCKRNGKRKATLADYHGKALVVDWQTQRPAQGAAGGR